MIKEKKSLLNLGFLCLSHSIWREIIWTSLITSTVKYKSLLSTGNSEPLIKTIGN